jgi:ferredoxin
MPIVSIAGTTKTFEVKEGEILYDSLYERGEVLPHGCLSGSCGACRVVIIQGKENLLPPGVIEQNTIDSVRAELDPKTSQGMEIRLSCRAKVTGHVTFGPMK